MVPPPAIVVAGLAAGFLLERRWAWPIGGGRGLLLAAGTAAVLLAVLLGLTAVGTFTRRGTTVLPAWRPTSTVVTTGPYRFTRNPMYLAMIVAYAGVSLGGNSMWPLVFLPIVVLVLDRYVIAREERYLGAKFGDDYERYRRRVRRWV